MRLWSEDDVAHWLETKAKMPQYKQLFKDNDLGGKHLPMLAMQKVRFVCVCARGGWGRGMVSLSCARVLAVVYLSLLYDFPSFLRGGFMCSSQH